jgi:hypothetical protein
MKINPAVARLVNRGLLVLGAANSVAVYPRLSPLLRSTSVSGLLDAERGAR